VPVPRIGRVVIGGWNPVDPRRPDRIASLLVGVPDEHGLRYVGRVGVSGDERRPVAGLRELRRGDSPFEDGVPPDVARDAIWVEPRVVGLVGHTGFTADGRLRLPQWRGTAGASSAAIPWARRADSPDEDADRRPAAVGPSAPEEVDRPAAPEVAAAQADDIDNTATATDDVAASVAAPSGRAPEPAAAPSPSPQATSGPPEEARRLEQHFVYNSLNAIASLIRTDPARARELLVGFADLSRATDRPSTDAPSTLGHELATARDYLALEQARFGKRLRVEIDVDPALHGARVEPLRLLTAVRDAVQGDIEPRAQGGVLTVTARREGDGCVVTVRGGAGEPRELLVGGHVTV
jgi:hypothetical protein